MRSRIALFLVFFSGCDLAPPPNATLTEGVPKSGNVVNLEGVVVDRFDEDRLVFKAIADSARIDREKGVIEADDIRLQGENFHAVAPSLSMSRNSDLIEVTGPVSATVTPR